MYLSQYYVLRSFNLTLYLRNRSVIIYEIKEADKSCKSLEVYYAK